MLPGLRRLDRCRTHDYARAQNRHAGVAMRTTAIAIATQIGEIATTMSTLDSLLDSVIASLRARLRKPYGKISVALFVEELGLHVHMVDFGRPGLHDREIMACSTVPREVQLYQIARAACAYALINMGLIKYVSPHDLAVALFDVTTSDQQPAQVAEELAAEAEAEQPPPTLAEVHWLDFGRPRKPTS